ncbi:unnamed protein product, partial [Phaeothamnion confervicola]
WFLASAALASSSGLAVLQRAYDKGFLRPNDEPVSDGTYCGLCEWAAFRGSLNTLKWLRARGFRWSKDVSSAAAEAHHLEIYQWLLANGCPSEESSMGGC